MRKDPLTRVAKVRVCACPTPEALGEAAAREFLIRARAAIAARGRYSVALSGGSTPRQLYRALAERGPGEIPWPAIHLFWGDERAVPPDHPQSNYRAARAELLSKVPVPAANVHRLRGEETPERAAALYEEELRRFFGFAAGSEGGHFPRFDLILLGMGDDGHTASLFPHSPALDEGERWVVANPVPALATTRLTLTLPVLNAAACVLFLVAGTGKAATLAEVLEGQARPRELPAQAVRPVDGELIWMLDQAAAARLRVTELERC
jgi:6-phosphogluconolactonase